jgi:radical SAM C-methyltransferase
MSKQRVVLVDKTCERHAITPLALGYLQTYAQADTDIQSEYDINIFSFSIDDSFSGALFRVMNDGLPDVAAFNCMGWSIKHHLRLAQALKQIKPEMLIVFGGNHVSGQGNWFLKRHPAVDVVVNGEGEATFRDLLLARLNKDISKVAGITFHTGDEPYTTLARERFQDLNQIPSPYLEGVLTLDGAGLMAIIETNRGCPYHCAFCYWGGAINQKIRTFSANRLGEEVALLAKNKVEALYIADANFGILEQDMMLAESIVKTRRDYGYPRNVYTNWAKNKNKRVVDIAQKFILGGVGAQVTIATQSLNETVLIKARRRNIRYGDMREFTKLCRERSVPTYGELIWGLPGETYASFLTGYDQIRDGTAQVWIYPLFVLPNSEYDEKRNEYKIVTAKLYEDRDWDVCIQTESLGYADYLKGLCFVTSHLALQSLQIAPLIDLWRQILGVSYADVTLSFFDWISKYGHHSLKEMQSRGLRVAVEESMDPYELSGKLLLAFTTDAGEGNALIRSFAAWYLGKLEHPVSPQESAYLADYLDFALYIRPFVAQDAASPAFTGSDHSLSSHFVLRVLRYDHVRSQELIADREFILPQPQRTAIAIAYPTGARQIAMLGFLNTMGVQFRGHARVIEPELYDLLRQVADGTRLEDALTQVPAGMLETVQRQIEALKKEGHLVPIPMSRTAERG